jgi:hypothetical protein
MAMYPLHMALEKTWLQLEYIPKLSAWNSEAIIGA